MSNFEIQEPRFEKEQGAKQGINLSALAVKERSVILFFLVALVIAGAFVYFNLGRVEDPALTIKVFTVMAAWPGATAQEMQDLVADPLEKRMQELIYYDHVDTYTRPGLAFWRAVFDYLPTADDNAIDPLGYGSTGVDAGTRRRQTTAPRDARQCLGRTRARLRAAGSCTSGRWANR